MRNFKDLGFPSRFFSTRTFASHTMVVVNSDFGAHTIIQEAKRAGWNIAHIRPDYSTPLPNVDLDIPVPNIMSVNQVVHGVQQARRVFPGSKKIVHFGYGFHSEETEANESIARLNECVLVASRAALIRQYGDKREARKFMESLGIPIIRGYHGDDTSLNTLIKQWESLGCVPVMVKAPGGGGGKGNRKAISAEDIDKARTDLGGNVILETFLRGRYKQVEAQIVVTDEGPLYLPDRDCSEMLENQKRGREISSRKNILSQFIPGMTHIRQYQEKIGNAIYEAGYRGPITVEFMVNLDTGEIFFVENNTRLQVEHNTTGIVAGVYIPTLQRLIAAGLSVDDYLDSVLDAKKIQHQKSASRQDKLFLLEESSPKVCVQVRVYAQEMKTERVGSTMELVKYPVNSRVRSVNTPTSEQGYVDTFLKPGMQMNSYLVDGMVAIAYGVGDTVEEATGHVDTVLRKTDLSIPTNQNMSGAWLAETAKLGYSKIHTGSYPSFVASHLNHHTWSSLSDRDSHSDGHYVSESYRAFT